MSAMSGTNALAAAGLPLVNQALLPAGVRNGSPVAKRAYETALGFEDVLVNELSREIMATATGAGQTNTGDGGSGGSDPFTGAYSALLPQALTASIMSAGGLGIARQLATTLDPSIGAAAPSSGGGGVPGSGGSTATPPGGVTAAVTPSPGGATP